MYIDKKVLDILIREPNNELAANEIRDLYKNHINFFGNATQSPNSDLEGKFVIIDLRNMDFMKNKEDKINYYDSFEEANNVCGMYEFEDAWILKLILNYKEQY